MNTSSQLNSFHWAYPRHAAFESSLRQVAACWFRSNGYAVQKKYPFILDERRNWCQNIILPEVASYVETERQFRQSRRQRFPLHKYLHHGLSSQAMLLNLVGPLVVREDLSPLHDTCVDAGISWPAGAACARFEVEDRAVFNETRGQPTSLDLHLTGEAGPSLFVEAKFVEREFGGCSVFEQGDCDGQNPAANLGRCYLHYIGRQYWNRMAEHGFLTGPLAAGPICPLANYYQFFRELLFAVHKGGDLVVLYDERNPTFVRDGPAGPRGLLPFLASFVPPALQNRLHRLTIQQVVQAIRVSGRHDDWVGEFDAKYGLTP